MKKFIRTFPLHAFLIGPAIIFFLFAHNYREVPAGSVLRSFLVTGSIALLLLGLSYLLFKKNKIRAAIFTTIIICLFFSYGLIYDLLEGVYYKGLWPFSNVHRYLIILYALLVGSLFLYLYRTKLEFISTTKALNVFTYTLLLFNLVILISKASAADPGHAVESGSDTASYAPNINTDSLPDIYYIILDGYANDSVLHRHYNYPSNSLTSHLGRNNFYVASGSRGNYLVTGESLGSSLNYTYQDSSLTLHGKNPIFRNKVCRYLKQKGYRIVHMRSGYSVTRENYYADTLFAIQNLNEFERTLLRYTIFRLDDLTGYVHYLTLKEQLATIREIPKIRSPKFSFIHIVSPHPPYICHENGEFRAKAKMTNTWWETNEEYLGQLKFINSQIEPFVTDILAVSKVPPLIIIQSDHGPWMKDPSLTNVYNARSLILNAYHIPYPWKDKLYSTITPVNTFPLIFNNLFGDSIPILKDIPMDSASIGRYRQTEVMLAN